MLRKTNHHKTAAESGLGGNVKKKQTRQSDLQQLNELQQSIKSLRTTLLWMQRRERYLQHKLVYEVNSGEFTVQNGKFYPELKAKTIRGKVKEYVTIV